MTSNEDVFTTIFHQNRWGSEESVSGRGSEFRQTVEVRAAISNVIGRYGIRSILDAPCGDFNWMPEVLAQHPAVKYTGLDVVRPIVDRLAATYEESDTPSFAHADITTDQLPEADLILSRDCLVHLTSEDGRSALDNFIRSGSRYLLTTHYPFVDGNINTSNGHWRPVNLTQPPYDLPEPTELFDTDYRDDGRNYPGNYLGLWDLNSVRDLRPSQK